MQTKGSLNCPKCGYRNAYLELPVGFCCGCGTDLSLSDVHWPPSSIDGADVLFFAWSGATPFFIMPDGGAGRRIFGLAICEYQRHHGVYSFSCDEQWETQNDMLLRTAEEALYERSSQFDRSAVQWINYQTGKRWLPDPNHPPGYTATAAIR